MNRQSLGCLIIILGTGLVVSFLIIIALLVEAGGNMNRYREFQEELVDGNTRDATGKVALVDIYDVISYGMAGQLYETMVEDFTAKLRQASLDNEVKAVLVRIDSPGGEVTASDALYDAIARLDETKPVLVFIQSLGASGAYYAAMGAREVMAHELAITGSIGVILQTLNFQEASNKIGVSSVTFKSGKMKDLLNPFRPLEPEEQVFVQHLIDNTYGKFVGIVAKERKLDEEELRAGVADGRILTGAEALGVKLIDSTGYLHDAMARAREMGELSADAPVMHYVAPFSLGKLAEIFLKQEPPKVEVSLGPRTVRLEAGKLYYISPQALAH
jgi:protease-4